MYAVERRADVILLAEELARINGIASGIDFIEGTSSQIDQTRLTPRPGLLVAEILGNGILEENVLEFTLDARDRFLAPDGQLIPYQLDICFFAFDSGLRLSRREEVNALKDLYGFDFTLLGDVLCNMTTTSLERYNPMIQKAMSEAVMAHSLDLRVLRDSVFSRPFELLALSDGEITGFCGYFKAHLDEETLLTNSPWAPSTHWKHLICTLAAPRRVREGEKIPMEVIYDGALRVRVLDET